MVAAWRRLIAARPETIWVRIKIESKTYVRTFEWYSGAPKWHIASSGELVDPPDGWHRKFNSDKMYWEWVGPNKQLYRDTCHVRTLEIK
jgi:hypothetical protein